MGHKQKKGGVVKPPLVQPAQGHPVGPAPGPAAARLSQAELRERRAAKFGFRRLGGDKCRRDTSGMQHICEDLRGNYECTWTELTIALVVILCFTERHIVTALGNLRQGTIAKLVHF